METLRELLQYFSEHSGFILSTTLEHFVLSAYGVFFAALVGVPVGILIAKYNKLSPIVISFANIIQTVPALAMLAMLMLVMGLGQGTVIVALFLYSLLPIIKNTYTGIHGVDEALLDSGRGMGMTSFQILRMVQIPLALSVIMAGLRIALVICIGIATVGVFIGGGGLGNIIVRGIQTTDGGAIVLAGSIPAALMAIIVDFVLGRLEKWFSPLSKASKA